jgi:hypothetical protein
LRDAILRGVREVLTGIEERSGERCAGRRRRARAGFKVKGRVGSYLTDGVRRDAWAGFDAQAAMDFLRAVRPAREEGVFLPNEPIVEIEGRLIINQLQLFDRKNEPKTKP